MVQQAQPVPLEQLEQLALTAQQAQQAPLEQLEQTVPPVLQEQQDQPERMVPLAQQAQPVPPDRLERTVLQDPPERRPLSPDQPVQRDRQRLEVQRPAEQIRKSSTM